MEIPVPTLLLLIFQLITTTKGVPYSPQDFQRFEASCMDLLQIPEGHRGRFQRHDYPDDRATHCFHRCLGIVSGLYSDREGADLAKVFLQFGGARAERNETSFRQGAKNCFQWMLTGLDGRPVLDKCERPFRMHQCFAKVYREQFAGN